MTGFALMLAIGPGNHFLTNTVHHFEAVGACSQHCSGVTTTRRVMDTDL